MSTKRVGTFSQTADALLDYHIDWSALIGSDTISASAWDVPADLTASSPSHTDAATVLWLTGGSAGESYEVTNTIVTAEGREDSRHIVLMVI